LIEASLPWVRYLLALLGLVAPGSLAARQPLLLAFPLSCVAVYSVSFVVGMLGLPLTFASLMLGLASMVVGLGFLLGRADAPAAVAPKTWHIADGNVAVAAFLAVALAVMALRLFLAPLQGFDIPFRWDFLARQMLRTQSFSFYPPHDAAGFHDYAYPDGFPPLISSSYFLIYSALGRPEARPLFPLIGGQLIVALGLTHALAKYRFSPRAAWLAVAALVASPQFFQSVAIGQETAFTAIALVGMLAVIDSDDAGTCRTAILAGLVGAAAPLAREYGWALLACGALAASARWRRRQVLLMVAVAVAVAAPWYVRNLVLTGNPLYGDPLGPLPSPELHRRIIEAYRATFTVLRWDLPHWGDLALLLVKGAPVQWTLGLLAAVLLVRREAPLVVAMAVVTLLFLWSVAFTAGGFVYAARVLSPAICVLSVLSCGLVDHLPKLAAWARGSTMVALAWSATVAAAFPAPLALDLADLARIAPESLLESRPPFSGCDCAAVARVFAPGTRILAGSVYLHAAMAGSGIDVVPAWSPEVAFLLDRSIDGRRARAALLARGIHLVEYDAGSLNAPIYRRDMRLFAEDYPNWPLVLATPNALIYRLPDL